LNLRKTLLYGRIMFVKPAVMAAAMLSMVVNSITAAGERQLVTSPIIVQAGDTLTIHAGRELLFMNFTGVTVKQGGRLIATGTKERPITFTSANDTAGTGAAFDWDGIEVESGGEAALSYCLIANSTVGVTAADSGGVTLSQCIFSSNGQWHLSIAGVIQHIGDDMRPNDYPFSQSDNSPAELALPTPEVTATPDLLPKAKKSRRTLTGWLMSGGGVAAAAVGVAYIVQASNHTKEYYAYIPGQNGFDRATPRERQEHFNDLRKKHNTAAAVGWTFIGLAAADGLYLTFIF
jgi:hypothetical protein